MAASEWPNSRKRPWLSEAPVGRRHWAYELTALTEGGLGAVSPLTRHPQTFTRASRQRPI
jgi:hypothetical protein